ncbi:MAG: hypothetical protein HWD59_02335 [Coxiellaceae bacterium]|nr:MAG: hypothetical protein HWD59_02335 [Coxiellaceae bacterium]
MLTFQDFVYQVYHESAIPALANKVFATELRTDFKGLPETANALVSQLGLDALSGNHEETDSSAKTETITEEVTDMTIEKEKIVPAPVTLNLIKKPSQMVPLMILNAIPAKMLIVRENTSFGYWPRWQWFQR